MTSLASWPDSGEADRTREPSNLRTTAEALGKFRAKKLQRSTPKSRSADLAGAAPPETNIDRRALKCAGSFAG